MTGKVKNCIICGKKFLPGQDVKSHMHTHTNERPFKCSICGSSYRRKFHLDNHIRYVHGSEKRPRANKKRCVICEKMMFPSEMYRHLRTHTKEKPQSCPICEKEFAENKNVINHMKSHNNVKGAPCVFCGKSFSIRASSEDHIRSHIKEKPFFCTKCPVSFSQHGNLSAHLRSVHLKERPFSCDICGKSFVEGNRDAHIRSHLNEKPFQCTECGKRFATSGGLRGHMNLHIEEHRVTFPCQKCNKTYANISNLKRHEKESHQVALCIICENEVSKNSMIKHLRSHINEKPYSCISCGDSFKTTAERDSHLKIHAKVRSVPVSCVFCEKVFPSKPRLETHIFSHIKETSFECASCPMSFSLLARLTRHNRDVHERVRQFPCEICGKAFANRPKLQRHLNTHLNEEPYQCRECGKRFRSPNGFKLHMNRH